MQHSESLESSPLLAGVGRNRWSPPFWAKAPGCGHRPGLAWPRLALLQKNAKKCQEELAEKSLATTIFLHTSTKREIMWNCSTIFWKNLSLMLSWGFARPFNVLDMMVSKRWHSIGHHNVHNVASREECLIFRSDSNGEGLGRIRRRWLVRVCLFNVGIPHASCDQLFLSLWIQRNRAQWSWWFSKVWHPLHGQVPSFQAPDSLRLSTAQYEVTGTSSSDCSGSQKSLHLRSSPILPQDKSYRWEPKKD